MNFRCFVADYTSDYANLKVMVEKGTVAHTYQPYIGADSIPKAVANKPTISEVIGNVEIETLKGKAKLFATNGNVPSGGYKVATCGRNALKTEDITNTTSGTNNGVTCSKNSNGLITMQGTAQSNFSIYAMNYGEYIMPFDGYIYPIVTSGNIGSFVVYFSKPDGQSVWATTNDVLAKGSKIVQIYQNLSTNDTINVSFYLAVSREKMTSYEPYVGDSATITDSNGVYLDTYDGVTNIIAPNEVTTIYGGNVQGNEMLKSDGTLNENLTNVLLLKQFVISGGVTETYINTNYSGDVMNLPDGIYATNFSGTTMTPAQWGKLIKLFGNSSYKCLFFISPNNMWYRTGSVSTWKAFS